MLFWSRVHLSLFSFRHTPSHKTFMSGGLCTNFGGGHKPCGIVREFLCLRTCSALVSLGGWSAVSSGFQKWFRITAVSAHGDTTIHRATCEWHHDSQQQERQLVSWTVHTTAFLKSPLYFRNLVGMGAGRIQMFSTTVLLQLLKKYIFY